MPLEFSRAVYFRQNLEAYFAFFVNNLSDGKLFKMLKDYGKDIGPVVGKLSIVNLSQLYVKSCKKFLILFQKKRVISQKIWSRAKYVPLALRNTFILQMSLL